MARTTDKRSSARPAMEVPPYAETGESGEAQAVDGRGIEEILAGLEKVVRDLEAGDLPLERALLRFEEGVRLARHGSKMLDAVEARVETLLADRDELVPFLHDAGDDEEEENDGF